MFPSSSNERLRWENVRDRNNRSYAEDASMPCSDSERKNCTQKTYQNVSPEIMRDTNRNSFSTSKFSITTPENDHEFDISPVQHTAARKHSDIQTDKEDDDKDIHDESCEETEYESVDLGYDLEANTYTESLKTILKKGESQIKSASDSNNGDRERDVTTGSATTTSEDKNASNDRSISFRDLPPRPPITLPPISPLQELVIQKVHRGSRHDDPEKLYDDLQAKCRKFINLIKRSSQYEDVNDTDTLEGIDTSQDIAIDEDRFNLSPDYQICNSAEYEERDVTAGSMLQSHRNDSDDPEIMRAANNSFRTTNFSVNPHEEDHDHDIPEPRAASNEHSDPDSRDKDVVFLSNEYSIIIFGDRKRDESQCEDESSKHNSRKRRADDTDDSLQLSYNDAKSKWKAFRESFLVNPPKVYRLCCCKRKHK